MPRLNTACADCGKKITGKDFESGMVVHSSHTGNRWCPKCVMRWIRKR